MAPGGQVHPMIRSVGLEPVSYVDKTGRYIGSFAGCILEEYDSNGVLVKKQTIPPEEIPDNAIAVPVHPSNGITQVWDFSANQWVDMPSLD
jgi:hypothetical protein